MKIEDKDQEKFYDAIFALRDAKKVPHTTIHHIIKPIEKILTFRVIEGKNIWKVQIIETVTTGKIYAERRFTNKLEMAEWLWYKLQDFKREQNLVKFGELKSAEKELKEMQDQIAAAG